MAILTLLPILICWSFFCFLKDSLQFETYFFDKNAKNDDNNHHSGEITSKRPDWQIKIQDWFVDHMVLIIYSRNFCFLSIFVSAKIFKMGKNVHYNAGAITPKWSQLTISAMLYYCNFSLCIKNFCKKIING